MLKGTRDIRINYSTIDRYHEHRRFTTLEGARRYARKWMGTTFDISVTFGYAVSGDGIGKITATGATLEELLERTEEAAPAPPSYRPDGKDRECMRCEEPFTTTLAENADYCPKCRANMNRLDMK